MPKVPVFTAKRLVRALQKKGFIFIRQKGSHAIFQHPDGRITVIPMHSGDVPPGTLKGILDDIGIAPSDLE